MTNENLLPMAFKFDAASQEVHTVLVENEPFFVAKDVCNILELGNVTKALYALDTDEKLTLQLVRSGQKRKVNCVSESGMYALILRSNKPEAKQFRKWITSEVLPTIRKKGFYAHHGGKQKDVLDARLIPYTSAIVNGYPVRTIQIENEIWISLVDVNKALHSSTSPLQQSKKLNAVKTLAKKIWVFGATNPAWYICEHGLQLILSGSRKIQNYEQLKLEL